LKTRSGHESNIGKESLEQAPRKKLNWPLSVGLSLVIIITFLAIVGPTLAPNDPSEEHIITLIDGQWYVPPFDLGTPGYPLGSDRFGRDLYSRLLWGIRPTMILVAVVAVVRLVIGVIIGLSAGWFTGKSARFLNGLIQIALSLPILLVALGAIALVGVELGIWAFIIGLSLTGWVDTAIQVREQTRIVKGQVYVEAASAIGASNHQILSNHILKQITPMLLMLFAFELSSTLMLTAGLGFLGYYIGGDVWVETGDFVAQRISGNPELGQMLATSWVTLTKPWAMVAVGTTVFITVLGFNLIGEGLRQSMGFAKVQGRSIFADARHKVGLWFDHHVWHPLIQFLRIKPLRLGLSGIAVFFILSIGAMLILDAAARADVTNILVNFDLTPGATPSTSLSTENSNLTEAPTGVQPIKTITYAPSIDWEYQASEEIMFGPIIGPGGMVYITTKDDNLHIINPDGEARAVVQMEASPFHQTRDLGRSAPLIIAPVVLPDGKLLVVSEENTVYAINDKGELLWEQPLEADPAQHPILDDEGNFYLLDTSAGLYSFNGDGLSWRHQSDAAKFSANGIAFGPDGNVYYVVTNYSKGFIQAVSPLGDGLWVAQTTTRDFYDELHISKDGMYLSLAENLFDTNSGEMIEYDSGGKIDEFIFGGDGRNYFRTLHKVDEWQMGQSGIEILNEGIVSENYPSLRPPLRSSADSNGIVWLYYPGRNTWRSIMVVWMSAEGDLLGSHSVEGDIHSFVAYDMSNSLLTECKGFEDTESIECKVYSPNSDEPLWGINLEDIPPYYWGIIEDHHIYLLGEDNTLTAVYLGEPVINSEE